MNNNWEWGGCAFSMILTITQTQVVFQTISLILTCLATLVTLAYTIWKWFKKARADGKITEEEVDEAYVIIKDGVKQLKENIDNDGNNNNS